MIYQLEQSMGDINGWEQLDSYQNNSPHSHNLLKVLQYNIIASEREHAKLNKPILANNNNITNVPIGIKSKEIRAKSSMSNFASQRPHHDNHKNERKKSKNENVKKGTDRYESNTMMGSKSSKILCTKPNKNLPNYLSNIHHLKEKGDEENYKSIPLAIQKQKNQELPVKKQSLVFAYKSTGNTALHTFNELEIKLRKNKLKNFNNLNTKPRDEHEIVIQVSKAPNKNLQGVMSQIKLKHKNQPLDVENLNHQELSARIPRPISQYKNKNPIPYTKLSAIKKNRQAKNRSLNSHRGHDRKTTNFRESSDYFTDMHLSEQLGIPL